MQVVGYSDRLSVRPGETIRFMVSCLNDSYRADIVRLIHGDTNPDGPGFKEQPIKTGVSRNYPGRLQRIRLGSHVIVEDTPVLQCAKGFTIAAWIYPTTPQIGTQGVFTKWSRENGGYGLFVENGELSLWVSGKGKAPKKLTSGKKLRAKQWYFVAASFDAQTGKARLWQTPLSNYALEDTGALAEGVLRDRPRESATPLVMAGHWGRDEDGEETVLGHYNGKLENPRLYDRALTPDEVETLQHDAPASSFGGLVATWDFSHDPSSDAVVDASPNR
ncbi:MAG: LamG domain-containing protein, partial [Chloroflexi bacterium]|nr:LamG domain-containing protein [Chloroflexota bacterium]